MQLEAGVAKAMNASGIALVRSIMHRLAMLVAMLVAIVGAVVPTLAGAAPLATSGVSVTISSNCTGFCFAPAQVTIAAGDTVTWVNHSGAVHDVTRCSPARCNGASGGTGADPSFTTGDVAAASGATFRHTFTEPGTYVYYCMLHGYALMHGTITVTAPAPTTTATTTAPIAAPITAPLPTTASAPGPTTPPAPQLANTGSGASRDATAAVVLIVAGLCATRFRRRRRSQFVR